MLEFFSENILLKPLKVPTKVYSRPEEIPNWEKTKIIATHNGRFHADETLAVAMLLQLEEFKDAVVIRTRNKDILEKAHVIVDVGATFKIESEQKWFDHHHLDFNEVYNDKFGKITKLSSCGLIYKYYGKKLLKELFDVNNTVADKVIDHIYENFFLHLDALDNGVSQYPQSVEAKFLITSDLTSRIARCNSNVNDPYTDEFQNTLFIRGMEICLYDLVNFIHNVKENYLYYIQEVEAAFEKRFQVHLSGQILKMNSNPPMSFIFNMEKELNIYHDPTKYILYSIYPSDKTYRVRAANVAPNTMECRKKFYDKYCGKDKSELQKLFPELNFVHKNGFLADLDSVEAAMNFAKEHII